MRNKAYNLTSYIFSSGEKVLVDTNIWLYLFPPPRNPKNRWAQQYSTAFANLIRAQAEPILDPMVMSEYLNAYCRIEWQGGYRSTYQRFKDFRQSSDFTSVATSAKTYASKILKFCYIHSTPTDSLNLNQALDDFASGQLDFNDAILVDVCQKHNLKLLTNDADFQSGGIEVLTTNPKLIQACP